MKSTDSLYKLVHAMSPNEKGYFKKFAGLHVIGKENNYLRLFDALDKMKEFNEPKLLWKFRSEPFVRQFPVAKNYLYDLILKSLRSYHERNSTNMQLHALLENAELLFEKGLTKQSVTMLERAAKLSRLHDENAYLLETQIRERRYFTGNLTKDYEKEFDRSFRETAMLLEEARKRFEITELYSYLIRFMKTNGTIRNDEQRVELGKTYKKLQKYDAEGLGFFAKLSLYSGMNIYHVLCRNLEEGYVYGQKIMQLWDDNPELKATTFYKYVQDVNNHISPLFYLKKYDEIIRLIENVEAAKPEGRMNEIMVFDHVPLWKINYYFVTQQFDQEIAYFAEVREGLQQYGSQMNKMRFFIYHFLIGAHYFIFGMYKPALELINQTLQITGIELRRDIQSLARIINLMIHLELKNDDLLDYIIRSSQRYIKGKELYYEFEKMFFKNFIKLAKTPFERERLPVYKKMQEELNAIIASHPQETNVIRQFDFEGWLESKITGKSFRAYMEEKKEE